MSKWALVFALAAVVAGALGFGGVAGAAAGVVQVLFFVAMIGFLIFLALGVSSNRTAVGDK